MTDLLHADTVQQLEVALLGSLAPQVLDLLSRGLAKTTSSTVVVPAQPHPQVYTSNSPAPPPSFVLVVGVSTTSQMPAVVVPTMESTSGVDESALPSSIIPAEVYPEQINRPGGGKDYLCCLCPFRHSNLDSILTHVRDI